MKVLLYSEGMKYIAHSGLGKAISHQEKALKLNHINVTTDKHSKDYTIIHINTFGPNSYLLAKKAKKSGKKVIIHAHSTEEDFRDSFFFSNSLSPLFKYWLKTVYRQADELITPTPYSKKLIESYNIGLPIHAVSNGIDLLKFEYSEEKRQSFREKYDLDTSAKIILSVGLYIKRKGIIDFFEVARMNPHFDFVWCGFTNLHLMTKEIKDLILDPPPNVHLLGYVDNMTDAYSACDCFFMPTYEETEGIVVLEALAAKRPVIIRDIPVYSKWLTHEVNCYKGTSNDDFSQLINQCMDNQLNDLSENAYKVVTVRSLDKIGRQLYEIYYDTKSSDFIEQKKRTTLLHN